MTIGWAILGTGRISVHMASAVNKASGAELVAVLSRSQERAEEFAASHGARSSYAGLDELLGDEAVGAVHVASPNGLHKEQVLAAARAGKHVLCEKPMAMDAASCLEMIRACEESGVRLAVGFHYRQHPAHQLMRETVLGGRLGRLVFADASVYAPGADPPTWYADPNLSNGGGILSMAGTHRIDLLRYILGAEVDTVSAIVEGEPYDESVTAMLSFDRGATATLRFGLRMPRWADPLTVYGTGGRMTGMQTTSQSWTDGRGSVTVVSDGSESVSEFQVEDLYRDEVEAFARLIDGEAGVLASGVDGLRAVEIASAIYEASRTGTVVRMERSVA